MGIFEEGIRAMEAGGVADVILPFILIFAIVFGVLQKVELFGKNESKKFNVLIALVMGLVPVFTHVIRPGSQFDVIPIINNALPQIGMAAVIIVSGLILLGLLGFRVKGAGNGLATTFFIVAIIALIYIFGSSAGIGWWSIPYPFNRWLDSEGLSVIVALIIFALVIGYITSDSKEQKESKNAFNMGKSIGDYFGLGGGKND